MNVFDAHVHLAPARCVEIHEDRYHFTHQHYGIRKLDNGAVKHFMPCYVSDSSFEAENLINLMNVYNVDHALILLNLYYDMREEIANAVTKYSNRLSGAMFIEPSDSCENEMDYWFNRGLKVIKFVLGAQGFLGPYSYPNFKIDSPDVIRILKHANDLDMTLVLDSKEVTSAGCQIDGFKNISDLFPNMNLVICHLGNITNQVVNNPEMFKRWEELMNLASRKNVFFDFSALTDRFSDENYPFITATQLLRRCIDRYGDDKFIWGTDIPATLINATYDQMKNAYLSSNLFTDEEKMKIMHDNAVKVYLRK